MKDEIDKLKRNLIIDNNKSYNNMNNLKNDISKNSEKKKNYKRPGTVLDIRRNYNEHNNIQQNNVGLVTNQDHLYTPRNKRLSSYKENKKIGNSETIPVSVNIYNATIDSSGQIPQKSNFNQNNKNNKIKSNSVNPKKYKYYLRSNTTINNNRLFTKNKKEEAKTINIVFN